MESVHFKKEGLKHILKSIAEEVPVSVWALEALVGSVPVMITVPVETVEAVPTVSTVAVPIKAVAASLTFVTWAVGCTMDNVLAYSPVKNT